MDPETAWDNFSMAISEGRLGDAREAAGHLADWLEADGFIPASMASLNPGKTRSELIGWMRAYTRSPRPASPPAE